MTKDWKPNKQTVELQPPPRPSRIRREPVKTEKLADLAGTAWWRSDAWEVRIAIVGIIVFALGINAVGFLLTQLFG